MFTLPKSYTNAIIIFICTALILEKNAEELETPPRNDSVEV